MDKANNRGFTLIEMMITMFLMAVIISMGFISMTMFRGYGRQNLRDVSRQFYRDFQLLKMTAMSQNVPIRINISQTDNKYSFYRYNVTTNSWDSCMLNTTNGPSEREFGEKVEVDKDLDFAFDSSGMVVDSTNLNLPVILEFDLSTETVDYLKDIHKIKIFPSGGIHVTQAMDQL